MDHYKISIPCNRQEAESINVRLEVDNQWTHSDNPPTIVTREIVEFDDQQWMIDIYLNEEPTTSLYQDIIALLGRPIDTNIMTQKFVDEDWVTMSQIGLDTLNIGRFHIHNATQERAANKVNLQISAGQAFGTGHHHTTAGCLSALDNLQREGKRFRNIADIGTGTGLLAFASHKLWPRAKIIASDIDPIAVQFAKEAAIDNDINNNSINIICASGTDHVALQRRAPYDLIIANILAGPLIELAPAIYEILDNHGTLILAGLLDTQLDAIIECYAQSSMQLISVTHNENWPTVIFRKRKKYGYRRTKRVRGRTSQAIGDYGEW